MPGLSLKALTTGDGKRGTQTWYQWWLDCEYKHYNTGGDFGGGLF